MSLLEQHDNSVAWRVGELNAAVCEVLQERFREPLWVQGELGRISINGISGHFYSTLKDDDKSEVGIVFFNGGAAAKELKLQEGDKVMICGMVDLYRPGGRYQLRVITIVPCNQTGLLMQRFREIRERLENEGLFAESRKRRLPAFPTCIGLLTSVNRGSAAVNDFISTIFSRVPNLHLRMINVPVQGKGAAEKISARLRYLDSCRCCDVIVITRGGGSMEDLWEFNSETLARTVAATSVPVVSAIGHQIDKTILDMVADLSVITPTDAAVHITETAFRVLEYLDTSRKRLENSLNYRMQLSRARLDKAASAYCLTHPANLYAQQQQRLGYAEERLGNAFSQCLTARKLALDAMKTALPGTLERRLLLERGRIEKAAGTLNALNPKQVLKRGYSIILDDKGNALRKPEDAPTGSRVTAMLAEGSINLTVN